MKHALVGCQMMLYLVVYQTKLHATNALGEKRCLILKKKRGVETKETKIAAL